MEIKHPDRKWKVIWKNISNKLLPTAVQTAWYGVVNNIVSTNEKLFSIGLCATNLCSKCNGIDTLQHRFICDGYAAIWKEITAQIAFLKRSDGREITIQLLFFPEEVYFPQQKTNAILWILGHYFNYVINGKGNGTIPEYRQYMQEEYFKIYKRRDQQKNFGNMLKILFRKQGIG